MNLPKFNVFNITVPIRWTWYDAQREKDCENRKKWAEEEHEKETNKLVHQRDVQGEHVKKKDCDMGTKQGG